MTHGLILKGHPGMVPTRVLYLEETPTRYLRMRASAWYGRRAPGSVVVDRHGDVLIHGDHRQIDQFLKGREHETQSVSCCRHTRCRA